MKKLTPDNWDQLDETLIHFVVKREDGSLPPQLGKLLATEVLTVRLGEHVPEQIRDMFDVSVGTMCYGYFFYPLFKVGEEQSFRVLEAAVTEKCKQLLAPDSLRTFHNRLEWLRSNGVFLDDFIDRLHRGRKLRNSASHAKRQGLMPPSTTIFTVSITATLIDALFEQP